MQSNQSFIAFDRCTTPGQFMNQLESSCKQTAFINIGPRCIRANYMSQLSVKWVPVLTVVTVSLLGCSGTSYQDRISPSTDTINDVGEKTLTMNNSDLEALANIVYDDENLSFNAISTGCTTSDSFRVEHVVKNGVCHASIIRDKPDHCRRVPFLADLNIAWSKPEECQSADLQFENPIMSETEMSTEKTLQRTLDK